MTDRITKEQRSWNMSRIKGIDTSIEIMVRKYLWHHGFRYRKNYNKLPGKPDVVLTKYNIVIFINGCFWHHHNCYLGYTPKSRIEFWNKKFQTNIRNDEGNILKLTQSGYYVITLWECELKDDFENRMSSLLEEIDAYIQNDEFEEYSVSINE